jgi:hypothetical protein
MKRHTQTKNEKTVTINQASRSQYQTGMAILIPDKRDFKPN